MAPTHVEGDFTALKLRLGRERLTDDLAALEAGATPWATTSR